MKGRARGLLVAAGLLWGLAQSSTVRAAVADTASITAGDPRTMALDTCTHQVRKAPEVYGSSRCFLLLVRRARDLAPQALQRLHTLQMTFPEHPFLSVVVGELLARHYPVQAQRRFESARLSFVLSGNDDGVVIADSRLFIHHRRNRESKRAQEYLDRLQVHLHEASDPIARQRAAVAWARLHLIRQTQLGLAAQHLSKYEDLPTLDLPYFLREQFCKARALALTHFRRYRLARAQYREVERMARAEKDYTSLALAKFNQSLSHMMELEAEPSPQGRELAERELRSALVIAEQYGVGSLVGPSRQNLIWVLAADPTRHAEALALAEDALRVAMQRGSSTGIATSHVVKSQVILGTDPFLALNLASFAVGQFGPAKRPLATLAAWRQLGRALIRLVPVEHAKWVAMVLVERIEDQRTEQNQKSARRELFAARMSDYDWSMGLLLASSQTQDHALAFQLLERSRARGLADRWVSSRGIKTPDPFEIAQEDFYVHSSYSTQLIEEKFLPKLEAMKRWVLGRIEARGDLRIAQVQDALEADQAMLAFHLVPASTVEGDAMGPSHVFVITRDRWFALPISLRPAKVRQQLELYRAAVEDRTAFAQAIQRELRQQLVDPIFEHLPGSVQKLVVLADDPLPFLSFSGVDPAHQWTRTPSASAWLRAKQMGDHMNLTKALVVVDPLLNPRGADSRSGERGSEAPSAPIPFSRREVETIREALPGAELVSLTGAKANKEQLKELWSKESKLLHISAHTRWVPGAPEMTSISLAPDPSGDESEWTLASIEAQDYSGAVVVLGGCATAFGPSVPGEGTLSLADAFLSAGASAVLGSLWPVRDEEAARFFDHFYRQWGSGQTIGEALHHSQAHFRNAGEPLAMYSGYVISGNAQLRASQVPSLLGRR